MKSGRRGRRRKAMEVKEVKKFFRKEIDSTTNSDDAFFFCLGYIVALQKNNIITHEKFTKLNKYILRRAKRREQ